MKKRLGTIFGVLAKSSKLIKLFKTAKVLKPLFTLATMAISAFAYSSIYGLWLGVGLVVLLFFHEMGHVIALKKLGYKASAPVFIPFVGAAIFSPKFEDREKEAIVGIGGPILGTIAALLTAIPYIFTGNPIWILLAVVGIFINLFNMIPMSPLDGGRITQVVHRYSRPVGIGVLLLFSLFFRDATILFIWGIVCSDSRKWKLQLFGMPFFAVLMVVVGIFFGYTQSRTALWIDFSVLMFLFSISLLCFVIDKEHYKERFAMEKKEEALRTFPPTTTRRNWLFLYLGLAGVQLAVLLSLTHVLKSIIN